VGGIERLRELGLGAMELEFVHQVRMGEATAREVAAAAASSGIRLSAHAPYYINFNSKEPEKVEASKTRLLRTAQVAWLCGARSAVFHAAFYGQDSPEAVYDVVKRCVAQVLEQLKKDGVGICLRPEVMGKASEFGTVDQVIRLSTELEGVQPAIDVAHWHAREGKFNTYDEFVALLHLLESRLGRTAVEDLHIHFSGIRYSAAGEISHLDLKESDFNYKDLLRALRDSQAGGTIICESPNLEGDALLLKRTDENL